MKLRLNRLNQELFHDIHILARFDTVLLTHMDSKQVYALVSAFPDAAVKKIKYFIILNDR